MEMTSEGQWRIAPDAEDEAWMSPERKMIREALRVNSPLGPKVVSEVTGLPHGSCRLMMSKMAKAGQLERVRGGDVIPGDHLDDTNTNDNDNTSAVAEDGTATADACGVGAAPHGDNVISFADFASRRVDDDIVH